jgi:hypothetical protein
MVISLQNNKYKSVQLTKYWPNNTLHYFSPNFLLINDGVILMYLINLLKPTGHVIHQQFNIQQLYVLPHTLYLCVLYLSENKQRLVPLTA